MVNQFDNTDNMQFLDKILFPFQFGLIYCCIPLVEQGTVPRPPLIEM